MGQKYKQFVTSLPIFFKRSNLTSTSYFQKHSSCLWLGHAAQHHHTDFHEPVLNEAALLSHSDPDVDDILVL